MPVGASVVFMMRFLGFSLPCFSMTTFCFRCSIRGGKRKGEQLKIELILVRKFCAHPPTPSTQCMRCGGDDSGVTQTVALLASFIAGF